MVDSGIIPKRRLKLGDKMFGHNDDQQHATNDGAAHDASLDNQTMAAQADDIAGDYIDDVMPPSSDATPGSSFTADTDTQNTGDETDSARFSSDDNSGANPSPSAADAPVTGDDGAAPEPDTDALLDIKQQALQQLTPLVSHLEQNPEEKFRTTMMMIQASDNHALIQTAYDAAQQITDEKTKAQALLDIVNEINYFTHKNTADA